MNLIVAIVIFMQIGATPIVPDGSLIVSNDDPQFPSLPEGIEPTGIDENWELLYLRVVAGTSSYFIRGEIRNISESPLSAPTLGFTLADGSQLYGVIEIEYTSPGARAPFSVSVHDPQHIAALNASEQISAVSACQPSRVIPAQEHSWAFADVQVEYEADRGAVMVTGEVSNVGDSTAERYYPVVFGFDEQGYYDGSMEPFENVPQAIFPGDSFEFEADRGFNTYGGDEPFSRLGRDPVFALAMAPAVQVSMGCTF